MGDEDDPYERQLLAVFESCDNSGNGVLDTNSLGALCDTLQLEENQRSLLISRLCDNGKCNVKFPQFRDALLAVLASLKSSLDDFNKDVSNYENTVEESFSESVFSRKKYGRRSRPPSIDQEEDIFNESGIFTDEESKNPFSSKSSKAEYEENRSRNDEGSEHITSDDFEIEELCKHLGVNQDMIISKEELNSIYEILGISNSSYKVIEERIENLKSCSISRNVENKMEINYGQFFQLIKNLGFLENLSSIHICNTGTNKSASFCGDGISNVDISISGCISYDTLLYLFENAGIMDAATFLSYMKISPQFDVNLMELASQLQEELLNVQRCMDDSPDHLYSLLNPHLLILQASIVVSQAQIKWYRSGIEQIQCERDKLRNDLTVANERASLLAQEVDDNHARMENAMQQKLRYLELKHTDQIKDLTYNWTIEREQLTNQNVKMEKKLKQLLQDETKLRLEVASLRQDYENLEKENRNLLDQLMNAENIRGELEEEIQRLSFLKKKVLELENSNEQAISFLEKMNQLQNENTILRDKNDELSLELENLTLKQMHNRNGCGKRRGNTPLEGENIPDQDVVAIATNRMFPKVRKYCVSEGSANQLSETLSTASMSQDESGIETDTFIGSSDGINKSVADINKNVIVELKSRIAFLENFIEKYQLNVPCSNGDICAMKISDQSTEELEKQCETLQQRLNDIQKEIFKMLSEKRACSQENCVLRIKISKLINEMQNSSLERNMNNFSLNSELLPNENTCDIGEQNPLTKITQTNTCDVVVSVNKNTMEWKTIGEDSKSNDECVNSASEEKLAKDYNYLLKENMNLSSKYEELKNCLDMLRNEYDQCEEYWICKLDEERKLFEEEQKISDEKFAELQIKIEEYSEVFNTESSACQKTSKLPTIVENDKLEKEVNDLQEEFQEYKEKMEREIIEKQNEIDRLMQIINHKTSDSSKIVNENVENLEIIKNSVSDNSSSVLQNISSVEEKNKLNDISLIELNIRKKQLKKECCKLQREKDMLTEQLIKIKYESKSHNLSLCNHAIKQHNAEVSKKGILLRLKQQEIKNRHLRSVLLQQQKKLNKTMRETLEKHEKELRKYRSALTSSQEMWHSLQETTKKQGEQIAMSDVLVKELYCENSQLMATIHQLEQQHLDYPPVFL